MSFRFFCHMIGVFDSGMGGLVTLGYFKEKLPEHQFLYLGDTKYLPYGEKSPEFLQERTFACLEWMFSRGCKMVVLACNTAGAYACKPRQHTYPDRKVLSVTVPGVEGVVERGCHRPLLLATSATIRSDAYEVVRARRHAEYEMEFVNVVGTGLVDLIEQSSQARTLPQPLRREQSSIMKQLETLIGHLSGYDSVILGCTHYPLIRAEIQQIVGEHIPVIDAGYEAAGKLVDYIERHTELGLSHISSTTKASDANDLMYVTKLGGGEMYEGCEWVDIR